MLSIHAHPDDESSKGAATTAKYTDNGVHATLVCATGGEEGDILNEAVNTPEVIADLFNVRMAELKAATDIIGYDVVEMLGYRDSGMKNGEANNHPDCFWAAPIEESATRFAAMLRTHRPHIVISYGDPMGGYDHPDHVRVWEITQPAIDMAADPAADLDGEPWQVLKLYNSMWSKERMVATHEKYEELGLKSPFDERWLGRPGHDHLITTRMITSLTSVQRVVGCFWVSCGVGWESRPSRSAHCESGSRRHLKGWRQQDSLRRASMSSCRWGAAGKEAALGRVRMGCGMFCGRSMGDGG